MTNSNNMIPDAISFDTLANLQMERVAESIIDDLQEEAREEQAVDSDFETICVAAAEAALDCALEEVKDVMVHKTMALMIMRRLMLWHETIADLEADRGNVGNALGWTEDIGKLKLAYEALRTTGVGDNDFTLEGF